MPDKIATFDAEFASDEMTVELDVGTVIQVEETDYERIRNKPKINGVELRQNKSFNDLGLRSITTLELIRMWNSVD